jgi:predicted kinase
MSALHLLIGPVGSGKSTWARHRSAHHAALFLDVDQWMVRLYGDDERPQANVMDWYLARRERVRKLIWDIAREGLRSGSEVILELGLVTAAERKNAYGTARSEDIDVRIHLTDAPRSIRRERVAQRNHMGGPFTQVVPAAFFEHASDAWEPVTEAERAEWSIIDA